MTMISAGDGNNAILSPEAPKPHFRVENVNVWVKKKPEGWRQRRRRIARGELNGSTERHVIQNMMFDVMRQEVLAIIGPSGCGKSTLLRCFNRMNDVDAGWRFEGSIKMNGLDIHDPGLDVVELRARVGWVNQKPNPFPKSIFENVAYGPKIHGLASTEAEMKDIVVDNLRRAGLYDEVSNRLDDLATGLSGGQQQRLCIARALAVAPEVILMDEPCSSLDPIATARIEELIDELRPKYTIIIVTHNIAQAGRVADRAAFLCKVDPENPEKPAKNENVPGTLVELSDAGVMVTNPEHPLTRGFVTGRFG